MIYPDCQEIYFKYNALYRDYYELSSILQGGSAYKRHDGHIPTDTQLHAFPTGAYQKAVNFVKKHEVPI